MNASPMRAPAGGASIALRGELAEIPPAAVLQLLELGRKTGRLEIHVDEGVGNLWLYDGTPVHAATLKDAGIDAAVEIVSATRGWFVFASGDVSEERSLELSVTELLLEATVRLDQSSR